MASNSTVRTRASRHSAATGPWTEQDILLIEDQRSLALALAKMIHARWGCRVLIATTMAQVQQIIAEKRSFFLAISDLNLPDAPDGQVIDLLIHHKVPTVAVTGAFDRTMLDRFMNKGIIDYILKNSINSFEYIVELVGRLYRNRLVKVLVVDDSEGFHHLYEHMLRLQNLKVIKARSGEEALAVMDQEPEIRLMLLDYLMPGMDGFTLLAAIRRKFSKEELAVIGITGIEDKLISAQFLKLGANDTLTKPFIYEELASRISQTLASQEAFETIYHIAYHDYLTKLLNRRAFFEKGAQRHDEATQAGRQLALAMMDIDFFKKINDSHGHDGGDAVLRHFGGLLREHFPAALTGRLGGEEFAVLFDDPEAAPGQCEAFRQAVERSPAPHGDKSIPLTVSIGLSLRLAENIDQTLRLADEHLYTAKHQGRNRVVTGAATP